MDAAALLPPPLLAAHPWLKHLCAAYDFLDASLADELKRLGRNPACGPGCADCCRHPIPLTPPEAVGLKLWLRQGLAPPPLVSANDPWRCPFLQDEQCAAYAVRPFACRRYLVFAEACARGEQPTQSRPHDVFWPSEKALLHALRLTLPVYRHLGLEAEAEAQRSFFTRHTVILQNLPWP